MGFEPDRAERVLMHFKNNVSRTMDHLLATDDDSIIKDPNEGLEEEEEAEINDSEDNNDHVLEEALQPAR
jgi:uncharacterized UBP type Zn finger protein